MVRWSIAFIKGIYIHDITLLPSFTLLIIHSYSKMRLVICKKGCVNDSRQTVFYIGRNAIENVDNWPNLGHIIDSNGKDKVNIMNRHNIHVSQINNGLCLFAQLDEVNKLKLLKSYCYSLYGCELWDLAHPNVQDVCIAWRNWMKRVWWMQVNTHSLLVPLLCKSIPLLDELCCRSMLFVSQCLLRDCLLVNKIARHSLLCAHTSSSIGRNMRFCSNRYRFRMNLFVDWKFNSNSMFALYQSTVDVVTRVNVSVIFEQLMVRNNVFIINPLTAVSRGSG